MNPTIPYMESPTTPEKDGHTEQSSIYAKCPSGPTKKKKKKKNEKFKDIMAGLMKKNESTLEQSTKPETHKPDTPKPLATAAFSKLTKI